MPRVRRSAALIFISMLAVPTIAGCSYLFPSCATIPGCPTGQILCNNLTCSDLRSDPFNCGFCNNACGAGLSCDPDAGVGVDGGIVGACICPLEGQTLIHGECLTLSIDPDNCGAAGHACRLDQACFDGGCGCFIPPQLAQILDGGNGECASDAGPTCTDLLDDPDNCGACGRACNGGCVLGACDGGAVETPDGGDAGEAPDGGDAGEVPDAGDAGDAGSGG
jgi:hypothetical protein